MFTSDRWNLSLLFHSSSAVLSKFQRKATVCLRSFRFDCAGKCAVGRVSDVKMTIIGAGYVGLSTALGFAHAGHETILLERDPERLSKLRAGRCPFYEPHAQEWLSELANSGMISATATPSKAIPFGDIIWVAVNTPARTDHLFDLSALEGAINDIIKYRTRPAIVVVRSTVTAGTCRQVLQKIRLENPALELSLVFNPEFLREGHAIRDFMDPSRVILGTENGEMPVLLCEVYKSLGIQDTRIISATFEDAEVIKQASNSFLAIKLTYVNELADYCRRISANIHTVTHCMGLDERIAPGYMDNGLGYGGACLPKDTEALATDAARNGTPLTVLEQAVSANNAQIVSAADTVRRHLPPNSVLGILGLSFKPGSGDLRCSPAWMVLRMLIDDQVYRFRLYDPYFEGQLIDGEPLPTCIQICSSCNEAAENVDGLIILTAHKQFRTVDLRSLRLQMRGSLLFDFFDLFSEENVRASEMIRVTKTD